TISNSVINTDDLPAAIVNGEVISVKDLDEAYNTLPEQYKTTTTKELLLNQLIQVKVLFKVAEKEGLTATVEEANQMFQIAVLSSGVSEEKFLESLTQKGITKEELIDQYSKTLSVQRVIDTELLDKIEVSDEEIKEFYNNNLDKFKIPQTVTVRHILIGDENLTEEEKKEKSEEILLKVTTSNFCDNVKKYSSDLGSLEKCGEYTFSREDPFVEEFKKLSFEQDEGDMGIAVSQYGPHIIWTVKKTSESLTTLDEAKKDIIEALRAQKGRAKFEDFYNELSKDSDIVIKLENI
ncbi:MAG: peptidylprolyl isomerase, partial [Nanoarchaeota archaeon]